MDLFEMLNNIEVFIQKLRMEIKNMPEEKFNQLFKDERLDYTQRMYLFYFRYM